MSDWVDIDFISVIKQRPTDYLKKDEQVVDLFAAVATMHPEIELRAKYIYETQNIYNANGIELDRFGEYVDVIRDGMNDDNYRQAILLGKLSSQFSGTPDNVMVVAATATRSDDAELVEMFPAAHSVHVTGLNVPININEIVDMASIGGVRAYTTHDYGLTGFSLAGIDVESGVALRVGSSAAMKVDENTALGLNRGSVFIGGSFLDTYYSFVNPIDSSISGLLEVNGEYIGVADDDYLLVSNSNAVNGSMLCGTMPK
ncbi:hypothetical protein [Serratia ficaria]|uniref:hypothetical protein n=1 Tax=Serratia ficaria TaxID=61651 RepID=UPI002179F281|nr:hypothetical protein [Serratia ficaria]CAI1142796.1 Uncharacterised protein [Serratia ficaria]CAI2017184.1 Uncharacterised protein [Serratia ficaria]CAI2787783.1 Uncharacterised protein [Serratia ficaria]